MAQTRVNSIDELRRSEALHDLYAPSFRHLDTPPPPPLAGEFPSAYERRLARELVTEAAYQLARTTAKSPRRLSDDEVALVKDHDILRATRGDLTAHAIGYMAQNAHRVAAALSADHAVGRFDNQPGLREVKTRSDGGHTVREYHGNPLNWLEKFMPTAQCVVGGGISRPMAAVAQEVQRQPRPVHFPPPPPSLGPQPGFSEMLRDVVQAAVAAAMPAGRGSRR